MENNTLENLFTIEEPAVEMSAENENTEPKSNWEKGIISFDDNEEDLEEETIEIEKETSAETSKGEKDEEENDDSDPELINFNKEVLEEPLVQELIESKVDARIKDVEENFLSDLDEEAKMFFEFKKAGGSTKEFLSLIGNVDKVKYQEDPNAAKTFLNQYLPSKGVSANVVSTAIENMSEEELMETYKTSLSEYNKSIDDNLSNLVQTQKQKEEEFKLKNQENVKAITDYFTTNNVIAGKKLPLSLRKDLINDLTKTNSNGYSNFQSKLVEIVNAKDERLAALAYLLRKNMDLTDILKTSETKATGDIKKKLSEYRKQTPAKGGKKEIKKNTPITIKDIKNFFQ